MHFINKSKKYNTINTIQQINQSKEMQKYQAGQGFQDSPFGKKRNDFNINVHANDQYSRENTSYEGIQNKYQSNEEKFQQIGSSTVNSTSNNFYPKFNKRQNNESQNIHSSKVKYNSYQEQLSNRKYEEDSQTQTDVRTHKSNSFNKFKEQFFSTNISSEDSPHFNHILNSSNNKYQNTSDVKKKLFQTGQSKNKQLLTLYKANLQNYEKSFNDTIGTSFNRENKSKISFQRLSFNTDECFDTDQNNPNKLNINIQLNSIKKKLNFETSTSMIDQMNKQSLLLKNTLNTKQKRKNPQKQMMKALIAQNKSCIRQLYELDSKNVEYEYRKSKFMSIFLGKGRQQKRSYDE